MSTNLLGTLLTATPEQRALVFAGLSDAERRKLAEQLDYEAQNPWAKYADDPVGFVEEGLGETLWSKQKQVLESIRDNKRTAVPSCHASGKSHLSARAVAWWGSVHPAGTVRIVTTASTFRQVRNVLWAQIRRVIHKYNLGGEANQVEWRKGTELIADGFSPADNDETATQGVHAPHLLVVVDEAGGISPVLGRALEALMTGGHTRLLLLGNPPVDNEGSWFEKACHSDLYNTIPIGAYDTPNFTGEDAGMCHACPKEVPEHPISEHLVDQEWVDDVVSEFGEDSAFVEARVHAKFPRVTANKVIPLSWLEQATENEFPLEGQAIRLGVDVAADGGDEFVIAWADGYRVSVRHKSSGQANANPIDVAGVVLEHIREAEQLHKVRQVDQKVRVKIDAIGVGWGVAGILEKWGTEQRHNAEIVSVNVSERPLDPDKFSNQRAEMWWNGRSMVQPTPSPEGTRQQIRLDVDQRVLAQLTTPTYKSDSSGRIVIESKKDMKRRGVNSPDRAEAVLLALYDPRGRKVAPPIAPISIGQSNTWKL